MLSVVEQQRLKIAGRCLGVVSAGSGRDMVLLHSFGLDHRAWDAMRPALSSAFRVHAIDLPMHGADRGGRALRWQETVAVVAEASDRLCDGPAILCGVSFGGTLALDLAAEAQREVAGVVAAACVTDGQSFMEARAVAAEQDGVAAQIDTTLARWFTPDHLDSPAAAYARATLSEVGVADWSATWRSLGGARVSGNLEQISCPALIVAGEEDTAVPVVVLSSIAAAVPDATFARLQNAPHQVSLETPDAFSNAILSWARDEGLLE